MSDSILADKALAVDWVKFTTMFVVSRLLAGQKLDDQKWMMGCLYTLLGFTAYHLVTKKMVPNTSESEVMKKVINTWLKVGTMLTVSRLLSGEPLNEEWMRSSIFTILGFNAMDAFVSEIAPLDKIEDATMRAVATDALTVATRSTVSTVLAGKPLDNKFMMGAFQTFVGFATYDVATSKLLK